MADAKMPDSPTTEVASIPSSSSPPQLPVFTLCKPHINEIPVELVHMIAHVTPLDDLARLIRTCVTMWDCLTGVLYKRAVKENQYHAAVVYCTLRNRIKPLRMLFDEGAILGSEAARRFYEANFRLCQANAGFALSHRSVSHPLVYAANLGHVDIVRLLLQRAHSINEPNPAHFNEVLAEHYALMNAITSGHVNVVQVLLNAKVDLRGKPSGNRPASVPLVRAAASRNLVIVKMIDAKLKDSDGEYRTQTYNNQRGHAIQAAIKANSYQIVEFFLHTGVDPNRSRTQESPLYTAVTTKPPSYDKTVMVELLLAYGASTGSGDPGLIQASWAKNFIVVEHILKAGCLWKYRGREVRWARLLAASDGRHDIARLWDEYMNRRIAAGDEIVE